MTYPLASATARKEAVSVEALDALLQRLVALLTDENARLEKADAYDNSQYIDQKNQILRELMLLQRLDDNASIVEELRPKLEQMQKLVARNHQLLKVRVDALTSLTEMMASAAVAANEDGTYERNSHAA